jgi:hypothetical protein
MCIVAGCNVVKNNSVIDSVKVAYPKTTELSCPAEKKIAIPSDSIVKKVEIGVVPVMSGIKLPENSTLVVGHNKYTGVKPLVPGMELEEAKNIIKENKIDEIIFKDEDGKFYIAYGGKETKGALDLENIKEGHIGRLGSKNVKIVHIDNETNTVSEGAKAPLKSTWNSIKEAGSSGITKGIAEMGTTIVAIFIGKSLVVNGMTAAQTAVTTSEAAAGAAKATGIVKEAGVASKAIFSTVTSGVKQVAVGAAIAGTVIGTVAGVMSVIGAVAGSRPKNDFTTLEMLTDPNLAFVPKVKEKPVEKK